MCADCSDEFPPAKVRKYDLRSSTMSYEHVWAEILNGLTNCKKYASSLKFLNPSLTEINDEHFLDIIKTEQNTSLIMFCLRQWKSEHENVEVQVQVLHIPMDERHVISAKYADIEKCPSIIFAFTPCNVYRIKGSLPRHSELQKKVVEVLINKPLPPLPSGTFKSICPFVFFFCHEHSAGCRDTSSSLHKSLPGDSVNNNPRKFSTPRKCLCGAGQSYFQPNVCGEEEIVPVTTGGVYIKSTNLQDMDPLLYKRFCEKDRVDSLKEFLKDNLPAVIHCKYFNETKGKHCAPFKGGGDLMLTCDLSQNSFVILSKNTESCSPRYRDDYRFASIEAKVHTPQTDEEIHLQLQANMSLAAVEQLKQLIEDGSVPMEEMVSLRTITTYGIAVCATDKNNVVLRMTADFNTNTITYERLFRFDAFSHVKAKFDAVMEFVVRRLLLSVKDRTPSDSVTTP